MKDENSTILNLDVAIQRPSHAGLPPMIEPGVVAFPLLLLLLLLLFVALLLALNGPRAAEGTAAGLKPLRSSLPGPAGCQN